MDGNSLTFFYCHLQSRENSYIRLVASVKKISRNNEVAAVLAIKGSTAEVISSDWVFEGRYPAGKDFQKDMGQWAKQKDYL